MPIYFKLMDPQDGNRTVGAIKLDSDDSKIGFSSAFYEGLNFEEVEEKEYNRIISHNFKYTGKQR